MLGWAEHLGKILPLNVLCLHYIVVQKWQASSPPYIEKVAVFLLFFYTAVLPVTSHHRSCIFMRADGHLSVLSL